MAKRFWGREICIHILVFFSWGTITWPAVKVPSLGLNAKWYLPQNLISGKKYLQPWPPPLSHWAVPPYLTGRCQGMPGVGYGGSKSSGAGNKQRVWDSRQSSRWRGHLLVHKTKGAWKSCSLLLTASLLLTCVLEQGGLELCASHRARWSWSKVSRLEVDNDGACGEDKYSVFLPSFYFWSSKSACCFSIEATVLRWVQYGLSDQGPNLWCKLKENTCSCENGVWSGLLLFSKYPALFIQGWWQIIKIM